MPRAMIIISTKIVFACVWHHESEGEREIAGAEKEASCCVITFIDYTHFTICYRRLEDAFNRSLSPFYTLSFSFFTRGKEEAIMAKKMNIEK